MTKNNKNKNITKPKSTVQRPVRRGRRPGVPRPSGCDDGRKYVKCVLGVEQGAAKVPDGSTHYGAAVEYKCTAAVKPVDGYITVACAPGLPGSLRILAGQGSFQNRFGTPTLVTDVAPSGITVPFTDYTYNIGAAADAIIPNGSAQIHQCRAVSYTLEVIQIGPVLNQQGNAATARVPFTLSENQALRIDYTAPDAVVKGNTFAGLAGAQIFKGYNGPQANGLTFDNLSAYPGVIFCSATEACKLYGLPARPEFEPVRTRNSGQNTDGTATSINHTMPFCNTFPVINSSTLGALGGKIPGGPVGGGVVMPYIPAPVDYNFQGDFWTPDDSEMLVWAGSNLGTDTTFEVKVTLCVEFVVSHMASIYRPLLSPAAERDDRALATVEEVGRLMPASVPKSVGSGSWWSALSTSVTGIGDVVASMGIPVVSPLAGVATKVLRNLGLSTK